MGSHARPLAAMRTHRALRTPSCPMRQTGAPRPRKLLSPDRVLHAPKHCSQPVRRVAAVAASSAGANPTVEELRSASLGDFRTPDLAALPPTPDSSKLVDVMPYLLNLVMSDRTLMFRLVIAFTCLAISKGTGKLAQHSSSPPHAVIICGHWLLPVPPRSLLLTAPASPLSSSRDRCAALLQGGNRPSHTERRTPHLCSPEGNRMRGG